MIAAPVPVLSRAPALMWTQRVMTPDARLWVVSDDALTQAGVVFATPGDIQVKYNARQYQTAGSSQAWAGGNKRPGPCQLSIPVFIHGSDLGTVNKTTDSLSRLMVNATRYYVGARFVTVLGCSELSPTRGPGGLTRNITFVLNLKDPYWRLSDDDARPTLQPIESDIDSALYPLGLFSIHDEAVGSYSLDPLVGTVVVPSTLTYVVSGQPITFNTLEAHYDSPYL